MLFALSTWLGWPGARQHATRRVRGPSHRRARPRSGFVLRVEKLEDRRLLAWVAIGPSPQLNAVENSSGQQIESASGRVSSLAITPSYDGQGHAALLLGAAGGGVWRSTDFTPPSSPTWKPMTDSLGQPVDPLTGLGAGAIDIGSIVVDPNNGQVIYAGTGEANYSNDSRYGSGVLKSTNGGSTWTLVSSGPNNSFFRHAVSKIIVDPTNSSNIYLSLVKAAPFLADTARDDALGVYKSTDAGATWSLQAGLGTNITVTDLDYTGTGVNGITIFAAVQGVGIEASTNGGVSWNAVGTGLPAVANIGRISLAASHTPGVALVYAAIADATSGQLVNSAIYKSTNGGTSWSTTAKLPGTPTNGEGGYALVDDARSHEG